MSKEHGSQIGLRTKTLGDLQKLKAEMQVECPLAAEALQRTFEAFRKNNPWEAMRYMGEGIGNLQVYLAVARIEREESRKQVLTHLETWALTILSSLRAIFELEWERRQ